MAAACGARGAGAEELRTGPMPRPWEGPTCLRERPSSAPSGRPLHRVSLAFLAKALVTQTPPSPRAPFSSARLWPGGETGRRAQCSRPHSRAPRHRRASRHRRAPRHRRAGPQPTTFPGPTGGDACCPTGPAPHRAAGGPATRPRSRRSAGPRLRRRAAGPAPLTARARPRSPGGRSTDSPSRELGTRL